METQLAGSNKDYVVKLLNNKGFTVRQTTGVREGRGASAEGS